MSKNKNEKASEFGMIVVTLIWGLGFPITSIALKYNYDTFSILTLRFAIGTIVLLLIFHKQIKLFNRKYLLAGFTTGIFLFSGFFLQTYALNFTSAANNAFLTQVAVIIVPFLQWGLVHQKPKYKSFIAAFIALVGTFILIGTLNISNLNNGDALTLGCALSVSMHVVLTQLFIKKYNLNPILYTLVQFVLVTVVSLIVSLKFEKYPDFTNNIYILWPIIFLGIFNTAFGFSVQSVAIKYLSSARTSVIVSAEAFIGAVAATFIINEPITYNIIFGGILVISAVLISETQISFIKNKKA